MTLQEVILTRVSNKNLLAAVSWGALHVHWRPLGNQALNLWWYSSTEINTNSVCFVLSARSDLMQDTRSAVKLDVLGH